MRNKSLRLVLLILAILLLGAWIANTQSSSAETDAANQEWTVLLNDSPVSHTFEVPKGAVSATVIGWWKWEDDSGDQSHGVDIKAVSHTDEILCPDYGDEETADIWRKCNSVTFNLEGAEEIAVDIITGSGAHWSMVTVEYTFTVALPVVLNNYCPPYRNFAIGIQANSSTTKTLRYDSATTELQASKIVANTIVNSSSENDDIQILDIGSLESLGDPAYVHFGTNQNDDATQFINGISSSSVKEANLYDWLVKADELGVTDIVFIGDGIHTLNQPSIDDIYNITDVLASKGIKIHLVQMMVKISGDFPGPYMVQETGGAWYQLSSGDQAENIGLLIADAIFCEGQVQLSQTDILPVTSQTALPLWEGGEND